MCKLPTLLISLSFLITAFSEKKVSITEKPLGCEVDRYIRSSGYGNGILGRKVPREDYVYYGAGKLKISEVGESILLKKGYKLITVLNDGGFQTLSFWVRNGNRFETIRETYLNVFKTIDHFSIPLYWRLMKGLIGQKLNHRHQRIPLGPIEPIAYLPSHGEWGLKIPQDQGYIESKMFANLPNCSELKLVPNDVMESFID